MDGLGDGRDAQLRKAIENSTSWRAVARTLGLKATSASVVRTIKARANRIGADTSHFTNQRRWTDDQLREAVTRATCWPEVLTELGVVDNPGDRLRVRGNAARLGLDYAHLAAAEPTAADGAVAGSPDKLEALRVAAPSIAMAWFALRGCPVSLPVEPQVYDLLVMAEEGIQRVQVKSCTRPDAKGRWQVGVGRRPYVLDKSARKVPYDPDSLDQFFVVLGDGSLFLIPIAAVAGRTQIYAHNYLSYRVGDASSLLG